MYIQEAIMSEGGQAQIPQPPGREEQMNLSVGLIPRCAPRKSNKSEKGTETVHTLCTGR